MAVFLSPVGGVAAQFFTSTGAVLTGGKLFTYAAGTTTPAATYTTSNGATAWTNPIVLDAAGRVPGSGEIWLTDGILYKFVLKDANDVLIATYDNISGINSNFVAFVNQQEIVTATAGQTVFNLGISYQPGTNSLSVFVDGVNQYGPGAQYSYVETDANTVTFNTGLHVGAEVKFTTTQQQGAGAVDAEQVSYQPPFTGSVATNVEDKLAQTVSVKDFGAVGDGVTDDTAAIQAALDSSAACVYVPDGVYLHTGITVNANTCLIGTGAKTSVLEYTNTTGASVTLNGAVISLRGLKITASAYVNGTGIRGNPAVNVSDLSIDAYEVENFKEGIYVGYGVNVFIGFGRLIGPGKNVSGSTGLQLGNSSAVPSILINVAQVSGCYSSSYETNYYFDGSVTVMNNCISESCINAINADTRLTVSASWVQADTYVLTMRSSIPITFINPYFLDGSSNEIDDITAYCSLTGGATVDNIGVYKGGRYVGPGKLSVALATSITQGLRFGSSTNQVVAYRDSDSLEIYATGRPLQVNRNQSGAVTLFGLRQQNSNIGYLGVDASGNPALYGSNGSNTAAKWDTSSNLVTGAGVVSTSGTDGFLYVPTCAGTPTGTPTSKTGYSPIIVDSTNHKLYFYSGGSWRDVGP